jgi:hypothetical protein
MAGDCQQAVCDGQGGITTVADDTDVPADGNPCTIDACANGVPTHTNVPAGTDCGAGGQLTCDGAGTCVGCKQDADCGASTACAAHACDTTTGLCSVTYVPIGQGNPGGQVTGDCMKVTCNGSGGIASIPDDTDIPDDGNPCTQDACSQGVPSHTPLASGTACGTGLVCDGTGACVGCLADTDCGQPTACTTPRCISGACSSENTPAGTGNPGGQVAGDCKKVVCDGNGGTTTVPDDTDVADDGNPCTIDACSGGSVLHTPAAAGTACTDDGNPCTVDACTGAGTCAHTTAPYGTSCGAGLVCNGSSCVARCYIGGTFYANGAVNPSNPCQVCNLASSTSAWTSQNEGMSCNPADPCNSTCHTGACVSGSPLACSGGTSCVAGTCITPPSGCATGSTVAWTRVVPVPPVPAPPAMCGTSWWSSNGPQFAFDGFAAGPAGDVSFSMQWLVPSFHYTCALVPAISIYRYDAAGTPTVWGPGGESGSGQLDYTSGLAFDRQGNLLYVTAWETGYCPFWACSRTTIVREAPNLSTTLFSVSAAQVNQGQAFSSTLLGGTAQGDVFAGIHLLQPAQQMGGLTFSTPLSCAGGPVVVDSLLRYDGAGNCLSSAPWPAVGVQAVGALGGLYTKYPFSNSTDAGCGPIAGSAGGNTAIVKLDATGACVWSRAYHGNVLFALGPNEELIVATAFSGTIDLGGGPIVASGTQDLALAVFDANGLLLWQQAFGAPGATLTLQTLGADSFGGPVLVGSIAGTVGFGCGQASSTSGATTLLAAFDAAGNNRYARTLTVHGAYQAKVDGAGGVYLLGTDATFDVGTGPLLSGQGVAVARIAP